MNAWWLRIAGHARGQLGGLLAIATLTLVGVALQAVRPWPLTLLVDHVLVTGELREDARWLSWLPGASSTWWLVAWLAGATVLIAAARSIADLALAWVNVGVGNRLIYSLGAELFDHLHRLSLRYHGGQRVGDLVRRLLTDSRCVRELTLEVFLPAFTAVASLVVMFVILWTLDPLLALLAVAVALPVPWLIRRLSPAMTEFGHQHQMLEGELMAHAEQRLSALLLIQLSGREAHEGARYRALSQRALGAYLRSLIAQLRFAGGVSSIPALGTAAVLLIGGLHVLEGRISVGELLIFLAYVGSFYAPLETLAYLGSKWATAAGRARRVVEVLDAEDGVRERAGAKPLPARGARGSAVSLERVGFAYQAGHRVLRDVSLEVCAGETLALVGPTGAGKSTLVSLIPRLFDPLEGCVRVDGCDLREATLASVRARVSVVPQEPLLLPLSVAENIAYGRPDAGLREVEEAAQAANAAEFIERLPEGYQTVLAERGATLSWGQRQRLAIARALLRDAPILILDEPTSALDTQTEAVVLEALERLRAGRTTFVIAHRLSTVRGADRVAVLEAGALVELGTHEALLRAGGLYARFHERHWAAAPRAAVGAGA
jgi:ATP-binding cassette subfamily B protein/subfamily B ATP-binding cassette protein MsbA